MLSRKTFGARPAETVSPDELILKAILAKQIIKKGLSVREAEKLAKSEHKSVSSSGAKTTPTAKSEKDADTKALEGDLSAGLGMKVLIDHKPGKENGQIVIAYDTLEQLDDLCRILSVSS